MWGGSSFRSLQAAATPCPGFWPHSPVWPPPTHHERPGAGGRQRGVCCGGPGSVCGLGSWVCHWALLVFSGNPLRYGRVTPLSSQPSWGSSGFQLFSVEGQYPLFCLSSLSYTWRCHLPFAALQHRAFGKLNGFNSPHHREFLDLNLKAVEHTWDFLCVCATSSESLDLSVSLFLH